MDKKYTSASLRRHLLGPLLLALFLLPTILNPSQASAYSGSGAGTSGDPYMITTCDELQSIESDRLAYYALDNDIDCGSTSFHTIGTIGNGLFGTLDGQNYTIKNLTIPDAGYTGLFATLDGIVKNLTIEASINATGSSSVGVIAPVMSGNAQISNVTSDSTVTCNGYCGGLAGQMLDNAEVINSLVRGTIACTYNICGGIVGDMQNNANVTRSDTSANITGHDNVGGIVGQILNSARIFHSSSSGNLFGDNNVGGIAGNTQNTSSISESWSTSDISGHGYTYGGIVGWVNGSSANSVVIDNVYYYGTINATDSGNAHYVGGIAGFANGLSLTRSYSAGSITSDYAVGGIAATLLDSTVTYSFSTAHVIGLSDTGPIAFESYTSTTNDNYFDTNLTGFSTDVVTGATPITDSSSFYDTISPPISSWSFPTVWLENYNTYPTLIPNQDPQMLCEQATVTSSSVHVHCVTEPAGWGITTWSMRYRKATDSTWTTVTLVDSHINEATITGLAPDTEYSVEFQFTNTWGTGPWGRIDATTLSSSGSGSGTVTSTPAPETSTHNVTKVAAMATSAGATTIEDATYQPEADFTTPETDNMNPTSGAPTTQATATPAASKSSFKFVWPIAGVIVLGLLIWAFGRRTSTSSN